MRLGSGRKSLFTIVCAVTGCAIALTACAGADETPVSPPETVTSYVTVTEPAPPATSKALAPTSAPARADTSVPSSSSPSVISTSRAATAPLVTSVTVSVERGGRGHLIGPQMYEATTWGTAGVVFRWRAITASGELWNTTCQVTSTVTGPGGYSVTDRSADCSGRMRPHELVLETPGVYTVSTEVIGPEGTSTATGSQSFEVFPDSTP